MLLKLLKLLLAHNLRKNSIQWVSYYASWFLYNRGIKHMAQGLDPANAGLISGPQATGIRLLPSLGLPLPMHCGSLLSISFFLDLALCGKEPTQVSPPPNWLSSLLFGGREEESR